MILKFLFYFLNIYFVYSNIICCNINNKSCQTNENCLTDNSYILSLNYPSDNCTEGICNSCGNGIIETDFFEICDDGNLDNFDGCNEFCQSECMELTYFNLIDCDSFLKEIEIYKEKLSCGTCNKLSESENDIYYKFSCNNYDNYVSIYNDSNCKNQTSISYSSLIYESGTNQFTKIKYQSISCDKQIINEYDLTDSYEICSSTLELYDSGYWASQLYIDSEIYGAAVCTLPISETIDNSIFIKDYKKLFTNRLILNDVDKTKMLYLTLFLNYKNNFKFSDDIISLFTEFENKFSKSTEINCDKKNTECLNLCLKYKLKECSYLNIFETLLSGKYYKIKYFDYVKQELIPSECTLMFGENTLVLKDICGFNEYTNFVSMKDNGYHVQISDQCCENCLIKNDLNLSAKNKNQCFKTRYYDEKYSSENGWVDNVEPMVVEYCDEEKKVNTVKYKCKKDCFFLGTGNGFKEIFAKNYCNGILYIYDDFQCEEYSNTLIVGTDQCLVISNDESVNFKYIDCNVSSASKIYLYILLSIII